MNWTEGNLARHSRGRKGKELLLRQKEHFSKARSSLLNANVKISPPSITLFAHTAHSSSAVLHQSSKPIAPSPSRKRLAESGLPCTSQYFQDSSLELPSPASFQKDQAEEDALRRKRQKLLQKGDWVGTNVQKPIQMEFSKPRPSAGNPWGTSRTRYHPSKQRLRHLLGIKAPSGQDRVAQPVFRGVAPFARSELRVRVGSQERAFTGSSTASPRSRIYRDVDSLPQVPRKHRSRHQEAPRRHVAHEKSSSPRPGSHASQSSESSSQPRIHETQTPLYHPVPCRPSFQQLLSSHSSDSENPASTRAQVGVQQPDVPTSQVEENEAWREFVVEAGHGQAFSDLQSSDSQKMPVQREVSPGISQLGLSRRANERSKNEEVHPRLPEVETAEQTQMFVSSLRTDPSEVSSVCRDGQDDCSSTSNEPRLTLLEPHLHMPDRDAFASDDNIHKGPASPPENLDELSLLVMPGSSSTLEDMLSRFDVIPIPEQQRVGPRKITPQPQQALPQAEKHHAEQSSKLQRAQYPASKSEQDIPSKPNILENEDDMWRNFVLGGSDDNLEHAYEEARKETARNLRPSDASASTDEEDASEATCSRAELPEAFMAPDDSLLAIDTPGSADVNDQSPAGVSVASVSHRAIAGNSSPDPLSELNPPYLDTTIRTSQATAGSLNSSSDGFSDLLDEFSRRNEAWSLATREVKNAPLNSNPPLPDKHNRENDSFRFARPKLFMGKQVSHIGEQRQITLSAPQVRAKSRPHQTRRSQKKGTGDGRTSIRQLPDFSSDPIEDVDEDIRIKGGQKPSLFGLLDVQEQF